MNQGNQANQTYLNENSIKKLGQSLTGYVLPGLGAGAGALGAGLLADSIGVGDESMLSVGDGVALLGAGALGGAYAGRKLANVVGGERANIYGEIPYKGLMGAGVGAIAGGLIGDAMYPDGEPNHALGELMVANKMHGIGAAVGGVMGLTSVSEKALAQSKQKTK